MLVEDVRKELLEDERKIKYIFKKILIFEIKDYKNTLK